MQINDAKNPCQICKKTGSLKCKGWFEDVQQGEWSALKQLYCFLNGHLTTACRPCNHPLGRALTKSRVCKERGHKKKAAVLLDLKFKVQIIGILEEIHH